MSSSGKNPGFYEADEGCCKRFLRACFILACATAGFFGVFVTGVLLHGVARWVLLPQLSQRVPVFLQYHREAACGQVVLGGRRWELVGEAGEEMTGPVAQGFGFDVVLQLGFPPVDHNCELGPTMVTLELFGAAGPLARSSRPLLLSCSRPFWHDWWAWDMQAVVPLLEGFPEVPRDARVTRGKLCLTPAPHVFEANVEFQTRLSGLRQALQAFPTLTWVLAISVSAIAAVATAAGVVMCCCCRSRRKQRLPPPAVVQPARSPSRDALRSRRRTRK
mmetsp:Transcript_70937/g.162660  ORF Transcript_70937/g.162660 Transcript_70937/m.162660 type:complete len:276 (+) Transcript_70937:58-885(+)